MSITKAEIRKKVGGKFFTAHFEKKDGTTRRLCGRLGVHKGVKGTGHAKPNSIVTVFEVNKNQFRSFDVDRLISLDCGKFHYRKDW